MCPNYPNYWVHNWAKSLPTDTNMLKKKYQSVYWKKIQDLSVFLSVCLHFSPPTHLKDSYSASSDQFVCSCSSLLLQRWLLLCGIFVFIWCFLLSATKFIFARMFSVLALLCQKARHKPPPCVFEYIYLLTRASLGNGYDFTQMTPGHFASAWIWNRSRLFSRG